MIAFNWARAKNNKQYVLVTLIVITCLKCIVIYVKEQTMEIYRFLSADDDSSFCHKVTKAMTEGWTLYGEPKYCFDPVAGKMRCGQAVIKQVADQAYDPERKLTEYE